MIHLMLTTLQRAQSLRIHNSGVLRQSVEVLGELLQRFNDEIFHDNISAGSRRAQEASRKGR